MRVIVCGAIGVLALLAACGGDESPGGTDGSGAGETSGDVGAGGSIAPPPVADTCKPPAKAADVSSPTTVVGKGAGTCTEALLDAALAKGGVITFDCGDDATIALAKAKTVAKTTVIDGGSKVTLDAGGTHRIFVTSGDVDLTVQNITLAGASVDGDRGDGPSDANSGAAIYRQSNSKLTVVNAIFRGGHATADGADISGGAIYSYGGDTVIVGSTFDGNEAASGGAIGNLRSNLTIVNSVFVNNTALSGNGGAVYLDGQNADHGKIFTVCGVVASNNTAALEGGAIYRYGYPDEATVIDSSTFDANKAASSDQGLGGALYVQTDTAGAMPLTITNSTISNNSSGNGAGGVFIYNCPTTMTNVTIAGNKAVHSLAGGLAANGVTGTLKSCTIADNHADAADSFGGGVIGAGSLALIDTIIANNTAGNAYNPVSCTDAFASGDHDLQFPATNVSGQAESPCAPGAMFADPMLGPLQDNGGPTKTMALKAGSPAIGAGADCPATDQRGVARSGGCDIGAVQHDEP